MADDCDINAPLKATMKMILRTVGWYVRNKTFGKSDLLNFTGGITGIHDEAVDHNRPGHRIAVHAAGQCPLRFHQTNVE